MSRAVATAAITVVVTVVVVVGAGAALAGCSLLFDGHDLHGASTHHDMAMQAHGGGDLGGNRASDLATSGAVDLGGVDLRGGSDGGGVKLACGAPRQTIAFVASTITVGLRPAQLSAGDFNEDGAVDVAVLIEGDPNNTTTPKPSQVAILVGNGHGGFTVKGPYAACNSGSAIASGKFSVAALHRDVVVGCKDAAGSVGTNTLLLLKGNGDGTLQAPVGLLAQAAQIDALAAADLDGNAQDDLIVSRYDSGSGTAATELFFQLAHALTSGGVLAAYSFNHLTTADVNGDRLLDPVAIFGDNSVSVFRSHAHAGAPPVQYTESDYYSTNTWLNNYSGAVGDLDGDGAPDVVLAGTDNSGTNSVGSVGALVYAPAQHDYPMSPLATPVNSGTLVDVALGDFDCDGKLDAVAGSVLDSRLVVLRGDGTGALHPLAATLAVNAPSDIIVADLDGDRLPDLVLGARNVSGSGATTSLTVLLNVSQ